MTVDTVAVTCEAGMMELKGPWQHATDGEAVQFVLRDGTDERRIKLKRSENAALYDFMAARIAASETEAG